MGYALRKNEERSKLTWNDYLSWPANERWEVIDGVAYNMTPSPTAGHQRLVGRFYSIIDGKLGGKRCQAFMAPLDVYLDDTNFVQPDVLVVCDKNKVKDKIHGAPDLVIEVLSPATSLKDKREKKALYERFGVTEYLIADPLEQYVERFILGSDGSYSKGDVFGPGEILPLKSLEGIEIMLREVFELEEPEGAEDEDNSR